MSIFQLFLVQGCINLKSSMRMKLRVKLATHEHWIHHPALWKVVTGKGWKHCCDTKSNTALKFAWLGEADSSWDSVKTSVCYAWWCARQSRRQIIVSILRKDHELQWFPKVQADDLLRLCLYPLYLRMSLQNVVSADDFRSRGVDGVPLCTDSTSDNEEKMLFRLKPQAMFEEENSRQPSLTYHATS